MPDARLAVKVVVNLLLPARTCTRLHSHQLAWRTHVSSVPPEIPYFRFSRVRLQASGTRKFGAVPSAGSATVKTDPVILVAASRVYTALRPRSDPPSASVTVHRRDEVPLGHLRPEVLAQDGLCCPACQRLIDLIRQSGELRTLSRFPVMGAVLDIQGSHPVRPPHLPDFHC